MASISPQNSLLWTDTAFEDINTNDETYDGYNLSIDSENPWENIPDHILSGETPLLINRLTIGKYTTDVQKVLQEKCDVTKLRTFKERLIAQQFTGTEEPIMSDEEAKIRHQCRDHVLGKCAGVLHSLSLQFGNCKSTETDSLVNLSHFPELTDVELNFVYPMPPGSSDIPLIIGKILRTIDMRSTKIQIYIHFNAAEKSFSDDNIHQFFKHPAWIEVSHIAATYSSQYQGEFIFLLKPVIIDESTYTRLPNPVDGLSHLHSIPY